MRALDEARRWLEEAEALRRQIITDHFRKISQEAGHQAKAAEVQRGTAVDLGLEGNEGGGPSK